MCLVNYLTHSQTTNFKLLQIGIVCSQQLKFDENGGEFSKRIKNTVGKGKIALYEKFLPFPQCFRKACTADT